MLNYAYYAGNYRISQYEDIVEDGKFCFGEHVQARYIEHEQPNFKGNLLIEALPPIKDDNKTFDFLKKFPVYSEEEKYASDEYRIRAVFRLSDISIPTSSNFLTDESLSIVIEKGYDSKRIGTPQYMNLLRKANEKLVKGEPWDIELVAQCSTASSSSTGFMTIGSSGCGKTTGTNNSLSYYPRVIKHNLEYQGYKGMFTQIPWIRVDCSFDGRIAGICRQFFQEIDLLLGTSYSKQYGGKGMNYDTMVNSMYFLSLKYAIGVLVVDEIQFIRHSQNGESLLNFFTTLSNSIKTPIVFIGTYKAINTTLGEQYAKARKSEGIGVVEYYRLKQYDESGDKSEWDIFIETLWHYQWVKNKTELSSQIKDLLYKRSLGIVDRVIKIFIATQLEAIHSGMECITPELINMVADQKFKLTDAIIKAYEKADITGDKEAISKYDDIIAPDLQLHDYLDRNRAKQAVNQIYNSQNFKDSLNKQQAIDTIIYTLNQTMEYKKEDIEKVAISVVNKVGFKKDTSVLIREVAKALVLKELESEKDQNVKVNEVKLKKGSKKKSVPENSMKESLKDPMDGIG